MPILETTDFSLATPVADNVYLADKVRITLITARLIRFEYAPDGKFEDRESLAVMNRNLGEVEFSVTESGDWKVIKTSKVEIRHLPDGKELSALNLAVSFMLNGDKTEWHPGLDQRGNLKGTARTLDRCDADIRKPKRSVLERMSRGEPIGANEVTTAQKVELGPGFISRDGWSLIDDSANPLLTLRNKRKWVAPRPAKGGQDLYFLAYGHDYKTALADAANVFGSQPLPPRFVLGYWYNRYFAHGDREFEEIIDEFDKSDTPIDVIVLDMDWHLEGWTGFTWDRRYFPDPEDFLQEIHRRGCRVTLNLHPANGVGRHEEQFEAMVQAMGLDPEQVEKIPFDITNTAFMKHYFEILLRPEEKRGVDFWWMDWQQGETCSIDGLDPLPWINHLHWEDMQKQNKRPLIFSRFGGIGSGRYSIGFSGDTFVSWGSLAYQPYFTATAANVLYGYWSHDIGGHLPGPVEPELYLRWMQFGVYNPILRTHTTKRFDAERRFAAYPEPYRSLMLDCIRRRYELVPYIYSENRAAFDTGVSLVHPLYYDHPEDNNAYGANDEYCFGSQMLVAPVLNPMVEDHELAECEFYLPSGTWFDGELGESLEGKKKYRKNYMLQETPVFFRSGAIVPGQHGVRRLTERSYASLVINIYPGDSGSYRMYEDDGISPNYTNANHVFIALNHYKRGKCRIVSIAHEKGYFDGFLSSRSFEFRLHGVVPPKSVVLNNRQAVFCYRFESVDSFPAWRYDGMSTTLVIRAKAVDIMQGVELKVIYAENNEFTEANGMRGVFRRLLRVARIHNGLGQNPVTDNDERLGQELSHTGVRISLKPETFHREIASLRRKFPRLPHEVIALANSRKPRYSDPEAWLPHELLIAKAMLKEMTDGVLFNKQIETPHHPERNSQKNKIRQKI